MRTGRVPRLAGGQDRYVWQPAGQSGEAGEGGPLASALADLGPTG